MFTKYLVLPSFSMCLLARMFTKSQVLPSFSVCVSQDANPISSAAFIQCVFVSQDVYHLKCILVEMLSANPALVSREANRITGAKRWVFMLVVSAVLARSQGEIA